MRAYKQDGISCLGYDVAKHNRTEVQVDMVDEIALGHQSDPDPSAVRESKARDETTDRKTYGDSPPKVLSVH